MTDAQDFGLQLRGHEWRKAESCGRHRQRLEGFNFSDFCKASNLAIFTADSLPREEYKKEQRVIGIPSILQQTYLLTLEILRSRAAVAHG